MVVCVDGWCHNATAKARGTARMQAKRATMAMLREYQGRVTPEDAPAAQSGAKRCVVSLAQSA